MLPEPQLFDRKRFPSPGKTGFRAFYYPYARTFNRSFLKQAILIFDELWFADPMERVVRETIMYKDSQNQSQHKPWDSIKDDYMFLEERGCLRTFNPCTIVREYDGLMAQAMLCDLKDKEFMKLASEASNRDYWGIYHRKIPELFAKGVHLRWWERPTSIKSPVPEEGKLPVEFQWPEYYGTYFDNSSPFIMSVEHCYMPVRFGYSVNINLSLLVSETTNLVLLTDDIIALRLLNMKYHRAKQLNKNTEGISSIFATRVPEYFQKFGLLGLNVCEGLIPSEELDKRSFEEIVSFKEAQSASFKRFQTYLLELTSQLSSEPWSQSLEQEIMKLIDAKVLPEITRIRNETRSAFEKMFGEIAKKSAATITPTLIASVLTGLSYGQILTLNCAAVAGSLSIALPELLELWKDKQNLRRNGLSFLLQLQRR